MATSYIAIGSNLGDRQGNMDKAMSYLKNSDDIKVTKVSSIYETEPIGGPPQGKFLNGVIEIETLLSPLDLLDRLLKIEMRLGRVRSLKNGPRTIDLDILLYSDTQINNEHLVIPHPHMQEREFVLRGLREIT